MLLPLPGNSAMENEWRPFKLLSRFPSSELASYRLHFDTGRSARQLVFEDCEYPDALTDKTSTTNQKLQSHQRMRREHVGREIPDRQVRYPRTQHHSIIRCRGAIKGSLPSARIIT